MYEKFPELIDFTISKCQHAFPNTLYVCLYGKAGKYVADGDTEKSLAVLQRVVKRYPRSELYTMIGDLYVEQGESALANDRYNQAFVLSETELSDRVTPGT